MNKRREAPIKIFGSLILQFDDADVGEPFDSPLLPPDAIHWSEAMDYIGQDVTIYGLVASNYIDKYDYKDLVDQGILDTGLKNHLVSIAVGETFPDDDVLEEVIWGKKPSKWPESGHLPWSKENPQPDDDDNYDEEDNDFERPLYDDTLVIITGVPFKYDGILKIRVSDPYGVMVFDPIKDKFVYPGIVDLENWVSYSDDYLTDDDDGDDDSPAHHDYYPYDMDYRPGDYTIDNMGREVPVVHTEKGADMYWDEDNECWIVLE